VRPPRLSGPWAQGPGAQGPGSLGHFPRSRACGENCKVHKSSIRQFVSPWSSSFAQYCRVSSHVISTHRRHPSHCTAFTVAQPMYPLCTWACSLVTLAARYCRVIGSITVPLIPNTGRWSVKSFIYLVFFNHITDEKSKIRGGICSFDSQSTDFATLNAVITFCVKVAADKLEIFSTSDCQKLSA
jgi:hypothetical protein